MEDLLLKGQAIGKVNGILFDKDGTLINSEERLLELSRSRVSESINLFKNQAAWSGKDIKIKHNNSREVKDSNRNGNYLKMIAEESKIYLDDQSKKGEE